MNNPYEAYNKYETETLSKEDVLLKTYEEMLSLLNIVKIAMEENNIQLKGEKISKVSNAISLLQASLDFEKGGEIAKNLYNLYDFCQKELLEANLKNDISKIDNVINVITPIYEGFKEAKEKMK
ncbi:flagellar export chaperone FliS [Hydrogenivirga sp. 128-5-R1-1]|uniref:flagellar export chaperone FliS n=1 Tax=Hydrogenivirga sp. 128-5-R1-1 TaxID=392423 RepID=UPI00015F2A21|nr:flagellar export chaperone FliS [Hydrogenivirga sp. 128-5-R1-1]EDP73767.1 Flagellin-specific chaperone FliS [Hydrogenivirga sp. 128-5-R1-1]